jgi:hypothetical protein
LRYSLSKLLLLPALLMATVVAGCKPPDEIVHYRAPRDEPSEAASPHAQGAGGAQGAGSQGAGSQARTDGLLGAIVPHGAQVWFFKLTGPVELLADLGASFHQFIQTVHFEGDKLRYDPPADWKAQGASGIRQETFLIPTSAKPLELAITTLAKPPEDNEAFLLPNINRWRGQLGLDRIDSSQIAKVVRQETLADGTVASLVVLVGKLQSGGMAGPPHAGSAAPGEKSTATNPGARDTEPAAARSEADGMLAAMVPQDRQVWFFKLNGPAEAVANQRDAFRKFIESVHFDGEKVLYTPPEDWRREAGAAMRYETFRIPSTGQPLELAVTTLVKPPGDAEKYMLDNVNRWRGQLGLAPIEKTQLADQTSTISLAHGQQATLVDLVGKLQAGRNAPPFAPGK